MLTSLIKIQEESRKNQLKRTTRNGSTVKGHFRAGVWIEEHERQAHCVGREAKC